MKRVSFRVSVLFLLLAMDLLIILAHIFLRGWLGFFDLDKEGGLKQVFSGSQLIISGTAAGLFALILNHIRARRYQIVLWASFSLGLYYLALDDLAMIHERVGFVLNRITGLRGAYESFNWMAYYAPFIVIGVVIMVLALRYLRTIDNTTVIYSFIGVAGFFITLVSEFVGGELLKRSLIQVYFSMIIIEEGALLIGETFLLYALIKGLSTLFSKVYAVDKNMSIGTL